MMATLMSEISTHRVTSSALFPCRGMPCCCIEIQVVGTTLHLSDFCNARSPLCLREIPSKIYTHLIQIIIILHERKLKEGRRHLR